MRYFTFFAFFFLPINLFAAVLQPVAAKHGMVVSEQTLASDIGIHILKAGGNAVDAAVAVGYALAVVNPCCGNIGGGGFMTIHLANGKNIFLNFREKAPLAAKPTMFLDDKGNVLAEKNMLGYLAVGVPGTVLGLDTALKKYGTMNRETVMKPAILLAEHGYRLTSYAIQLLNDSLPYLQKQPNIAAIFLKNNKPFQPGDILIQKDLSETLKQIAAHGSDIFYKGYIAKEIVAASQKKGGILSLADFAKYSVEELTPIQCHYHGYTIISAPPPSSGGVTLCEITNILENYSLTKVHSAQDVHFTVEAMRYAFADRNHQLGDPHFVNNPVKKLISKEYAKTIQHKILENHAATDMTPSVEITHQSLNTTHYSVIDKKGNAVSVTYTLNSFFGAKVIAGDTGFFLNNEMDDFAIKPGSANQFGLVQGDANNIQPGKRPLSSMTPTIILKNQKVFMVLGSPGGPRIITATLETLLNVIDYKMNIQQAVDAPRFHHQWLPDNIDYESGTFSKDTIKNLENRGYHLKWQKTWGAVEAILRNPADGMLYGANDGRRPDGKAVGY